MYCILIHSCDKYDYIWDCIFHYINSLIDIHNFKGNIYFLNEEKTINQKNIIQLKYGKSTLGKKDWSNMLLYALDNIKEEDIFYILDDNGAGLRRPLSINNLDVIYNYYKDRLLNAFKFKNLDSNFPRLNIIDTFRHYDIGIPQEGSSYIINCQYGFWNKLFLKNFVEKNWEAVDFEHKGTDKIHKLLQDKTFNLKFEYILFDTLGDDLVNNGKLSEHGKRYINDLGKYSLQFENLLCEIYNNCNGEFINNISIKNNELYVNYYNKELTKERNSYFKSCGLYIGLYYDRFNKKDIYKLSFTARSEIFEKDLLFRIYTGIRWEIIDLPITTENQKFVIETEFNFEKSSIWRLSSNIYPVNNKIILSHFNLLSD